MYSGFLQDAEAAAFAYDLEQELQPRAQPQYLGAVPPEPPDAGICGPTQLRVGRREPRTRRHLGTGKPLGR